MIIDKIENLSRYYLPQPGFQKLGDAIKGLHGRPFTQGRFDIEGEVLFGIGLEYETKDASECLWEAHRKYIDIHVILKGEEIIQVNDLYNMEVFKAYCEEDDYALFSGVGRDEVCLGAGNFLILYPNEVHKTSIAVAGNVSKVVKNVFKLAF